MSVVIKSDAVSTLAPSTLGKLADRLFASAAAIFSVRNIVSTRVGPVLRGRRSADAVEQDFTEAQLYDGTLKNFANSGDVTVSLWYNQGNGPNMSTATVDRQPKIVSAGNPIISKGKLVVQFDGSNDYLGCTLNIPQPFSLFTTGLASSKQYGYVFEARDISTPNGSDGKTVAVLTQLPGQGEDFYTGKDTFGGSNLAAGTPFAYYADASPTGTHFYNNRNNMATGSNGGYSIGTIILGSSQSFNSFSDVAIQELIIFPTVISSALEKEIFSRVVKYYGL